MEFRESFPKVSRGLLFHFPRRNSRGGCVTGVFRALHHGPINSASNSTTKEVGFALPRCGFLSLNLPRRSRIQRLCQISHAMIFGFPVGSFSTPIIWKKCYAQLLSDVHYLLLYNQVICTRYSRTLQSSRLRENNWISHTDVLLNHYNVLYRVRYKIHINYIYVKGIHISSRFIETNRQVSQLVLCNVRHVFCYKAVCNVRFCWKLCTT